MYEQISHSLLNEILFSLKENIIKQRNMRYFYTRLGANFYSIHLLFTHLYGERCDINIQMQRLVEVMAKQYIARPAALKKLDLKRENDHTWFLSQKWIGMALYCDGFAGNLKGLKSKLSYLQDLGINMVHVMPILDCPPEESDGGYAVRDFRKVDERIGSLADIKAISSSMRQREMLLTLDVVLNHTSDEHEWAQKARQGDPAYQDFYYVFEDRVMPDIYEETMPDIFPENAPGSFTWNEEMEKWVMTSFNNYQWDLNYKNPAVFIEMLDIILFWANQGVDILRLDAVAFLWKKVGTSCQNEREAHLILQLMKDCCQVTAPGVLFIAEAIVAPTEVIKYFGEDAIVAKECEIAYNVTFMALLWDAMATKNAKLLNQGLKSLPNKLERATWLNYIRCHDDIGLGFADEDIVKAGYNPIEHRRFLLDYLTGQFADSTARGKPFGINKKTGDARIAGSLASLAGLEQAIESGNEQDIDESIKRILLLHSLILSFGGIPLLYYGDEIGTLNDYSYEEHEHKHSDSRWIHRPSIDWSKAELRTQPGTVEFRIFTALKKMIAVRKEIAAFADFNGREMIEVDNSHLLVFSQLDQQVSSKIIVIANFDAIEQQMDIEVLQHLGLSQIYAIKDEYTGQGPEIVNNQLVIPAYGFYWLTGQRI